MKLLPQSGRSVHRYFRLLPLVALLAACGDNLGPSFWDATPVTVTLYSASRADYLGFASAVDLASPTVATVSIEAPGATYNWDFVLAHDQGGLALVPAGAMAGIQSRARIAVLEGVDFIDVTEAPRDTALYSAAPVPLRTGVVYVVRSRRAPCGYTNAHRYARILPVEIDQERGIARLAIVRNPFCDDRALIPPAE
jgi:hypothetical protein